MRVVVCGYMIRHPVPGNMLAFLPYVAGLHRLGHDVVYLEESGWEDSAFNPVSGTYGDDPTYGLHTVRELFRAHDLPVPVWYHNRQTRWTDGTSEGELTSTLRTADLLLNVGGVCFLPEFSTCRRRALVDMDPLFTQVGCFAHQVLDDYDVHFTYGTNVGQASCRIPSRGRRWIPTLPPVLIEIWRDGSAPYRDVFTTIANWDAYGAVTHDGVTYGPKSEEFLRLIALPGHVDAQLELTLSGVDEQAAKAFRKAGWSIRSGGDLLSVDAYMNYIRTSRAEFSVAKNAYVRSQSGWVSDRSAAYLACRRPVVVQDTGLHDSLPLDRGIVTFSTLAEAAAAIRDVVRRYEEHVCEAGRLVEQYFNYDVVLPRLLDLCFDPSRSTPLGPA